jgi:hypothetical protein
MLETSLVFKGIYSYDPHNSFSNKYLQFFSAIHNVTTCPSAGYAGTLHRVVTQLSYNNANVPLSITLFILLIKGFLM